MTSFAEEPSRSALSADGELALAYLAGDPAAFDTLYRRHHPDVLRFVRASVRDSALAEDVAQETMTRALRYLHTFDPTQRFWPWVRQVAKSVIAAEVGRRAPEIPVDEVDDRLLAVTDWAERVVTRDAVAQALARVPQRQRRALVMRYVEGRDAADIAELFGMSRNALEQLLNRARTNFRGGYRDTGIVPVGGVFGALGARLRRLVAAVEARLHAATGTTLSVAGDVAIGAAIALGGIGIVVIGHGDQGPAHAALPQPGGAATAGWPAGYDAARVTTIAARTATDGADPAAASVLGVRLVREAAGETGGRPGGADTIGGDRWDRRPGVPAAPVPGTAPSAPPDEPEQSPVPAPSPSPWAPPTPAAAPAPAPPAPTPTPTPTDPAPSNGPAWVDEDGGGVEIAHDDVPDTSGGIVVSNPPPEEGSVKEKHYAKTVVGGVPVGTVGGVSMNGDGSMTCDEYGICVLP